MRVLYGKCETRVGSVSVTNAKPLHLGLCLGGLGNMGMLDRAGVQDGAQ